MKGESKNGVGGSSALLTLLSNFSLGSSSLLSLRAEVAGLDSVL